MQDAEEGLNIFQVLVALLGCSKTVVSMLKHCLFGVSTPVDSKIRYQILTLDMGLQVHFYLMMSGRLEQDVTELLSQKHRPMIKYCSQIDQTTFRTAWVITFDQNLCLCIQFDLSLPKVYILCPRQYSVPTHY